MIYGEQDYSALERDAYRRGDTVTAGIIAELQDALGAERSALADMEKERDEEAERANKAEEVLAERAADADRTFQAIDIVLAKCARFRHRAELETAIQEAYNSAVGA